MIEDDKLLPKNKKQKQKPKMEQKTKYNPLKSINLQDTFRSMSEPQ